MPIECTCAAKDMPFGRCCKAPTSASVVAGLEMALSQAAAMIERQQHVMQRAMDAWDTTTHQKNGDGRLWQCMEELRDEIPMTSHPCSREGGVMAYIPTPIAIDENELAVRWGLSIKTLRRWRQEHLGPVFCKLGARVIYLIQEIEAFERRVSRDSTKPTQPTTGE